MIKPGDIHNGRIYAFAKRAWGYNSDGGKLQPVTFVHFVDGWIVD